MPYSTKLLAEPRLDEVRCGQDATKRGIISQQGAGKNQKHQNERPVMKIVIILAELHLLK
jgi:hypothetical protein